MINNLWNAGFISHASPCLEVHPFSGWGDSSSFSHINVVCAEKGEKSNKWASRWRISEPNPLSWPVNTNAGMQFVFLFFLFFSFWLWKKGRSEFILPQAWTRRAWYHHKTFAILCSLSLEACLMSLHWFLLCLSTVVCIALLCLTFWSLRKPHPVMPAPCKLDPGSYPCEDLQRAQHFCLISVYIVSLPDNGLPIYPMGSSHRAGSTASKGSPSLPGGFCID